jgi:predicted transcriptional regulator
MLDALTQKAFGGSAASLMMRMLSGRRVSTEELEEIERLIQEAREGDSP